MKRTVLWMMILMVVSIVLSGCDAGELLSRKTTAPEREQVADAPEAESSALMLVGRFTGFADPHSVEIIVDGKPITFSMNEQIREDTKILALKEHDGVMYGAKKVDQ